MRVENFAALSAASEYLQKSDEAGSQLLAVYTASCLHLGEISAEAVTYRLHHPNIPASYHVIPAYSLESTPESSGNCVLERIR